jgi:hypothetical protein
MAFVTKPDRWHRAEYFRRRAEPQLTAAAVRPRAKTQLHRTAMAFVAAATPGLGIRVRHCGLGTIRPIRVLLRLQTALPRSRMHCLRVCRPSRLGATALPACRRRPQASTASAAARGCRRWAEDYFLSPPHTQFTSRNFYWPHVRL